MKTTVFLADMNDFAAFNEVYAKYFTSKPARSCVAVRELPKGVLCEIEAIASPAEVAPVDLTALRDTGVIAGAISGRALYDGALDLGAALKALAELATRSPTERQIKLSPALRINAPGNRPSSVSTWNPLQMPKT